MYGMFDKAFLDLPERSRRKLKELLKVDDTVVWKKGPKKGCKGSDGKNWCAV